MKISVIIPCYNQSNFINETCQSLINQKYTNWEALLINDGSTDDTEEICQKICKEDSRFIYYYKKNGGLSSARNFGLNKASGDYIQFLDSDDLLEPNKLYDSINSNFDLIITNFKMLCDYKKTVPFCKLQVQEFTFKSILLEWDHSFSIPIHCGLFSKKIIGTTRFNEDLKAKEDWFFWLNIFYKSPKINFINKSYALYRLHDFNMCKDINHMFNNTIKVYEYIYNWLEDDYKIIFFNGVVKRLINEKEKSEYLFKEKNRLNKITKRNTIIKILVKIDSFFRKN